MAYNKIGFTKGSTLKASDLNHIEEGISGIKTFDIYGGASENGDDSSLVFQNFSLFPEAQAAIASQKNTVFFLHFNEDFLKISCSSLFVGLQGMGNESIIMAMFLVGSTPLLLAINPDGSIVQTEM